MLVEDIITDETTYLRMFEFILMMWFQQIGTYKYVYINLTAS